MLFSNTTLLRRENSKRGAPKPARFHSARPTPPEYACALGAPRIQQSVIPWTRREPQSRTCFAAKTRRAQRGGGHVGGAYKYMSALAEAGFEPAQITYVPRKLAVGLL